VRSGFGIPDPMTLLALSLWSMEMNADMFMV
jgi:hypothetical protein